MVGCMIKTCIKHLIYYMLKKSVSLPFTAHLFPILMHKRRITATAVNAAVKALFCIGKKGELLVTMS